MKVETTAFYKLRAPCWALCWDIIWGSYTHPPQISDLVAVAER